MIKSIDYVALDRENCVYVETYFNAESFSIADKQLGLDYTNEWHRQCRKLEHTGTIDELDKMLHLLERNKDYENIAHPLAEIIFYKLQQILGNEITFEHIKYNIVTD